MVANNYCLSVLPPVTPGVILRIPSIYRTAEYTGVTNSALVPPSAY